MTTNAKLRKALRLQHVPRWGIVPTLRQQSVAEHVQGVASIALWMVRIADSIMSDVGEILTYALEHDEQESITGDIPAVAKQRGIVKLDNDKRTVSPLSRGVVKLADYLEAMVFLKMESAMGNSTVDDIFDYVYKDAEEYYNRIDWMGKYLGVGSFWDLWKQLMLETDPKLHPGMRNE